MLKGMAKCGRGNQSLEKALNQKNVCIKANRKPISSRRFSKVLSSQDTVLGAASKLISEIKNDLLGRGSGWMRV